MKVAGYASTIDRDSCGDVICAEAWEQGLERYRTNSILLYQHNSRTPIGKVDSITLDANGLYVEATLSSVGERFQGVNTLVEDRVLKAFSVGFRCLDAKYEPKNDTFYITKAELLEISIVSVPANQKCLFSEVA